MLWRVSVFSLNVAINQTLKHYKWWCWNLEGKILVHFQIKCICLVNSFPQLQQALSMQVDHQPSGPEISSRRRATAPDSTDQESNHQAALQNIQKSLSISTLPSNPNHQVQMMPSLTRKKPSQWVVYLHHLHYCQAHPHYYHCFQFVRPRDPISWATIQDWEI